MEWTWWQKAMALAGAVAAMWAIVPLMVLAGTDSWRRALQALRQYLLVLGGLALLGGGVGLLMALATWIG